MLLHDTPSRRLVRSFGLALVTGAYDAAPAAPIPAELEWLRDRCAGLMGHQPEELADLLVTRYPPGAGIGWHRDAPLFGEVSGISLLAACWMRFRRGRPRAWQTSELTLEPAPPTSCPVGRGRNGSTTSLRSRRSGGR